MTKKKQIYPILGKSSRRILELLCRILMWAICNWDIRIWWLALQISSLKCSGIEELWFSVPEFDYDVFVIKGHYCAGTETLSRKNGYGFAYTYFYYGVFITLKCRLLAMEQLKMLPISQNSSEIQHNRRIVKNGCLFCGIHFSSEDNVLFFIPWLSK